jgi:hypothetical protein
MPEEPNAQPTIWGNLLHLSMNMWTDHQTPLQQNKHARYSSDLRFDDSLWNDLLPLMAEAGVNMAVLDLGDGVEYRSHPEIAVRGAWTPECLRRELGRLRALGIEPIPKLNFSTCHDAWLGVYSRCVSTPAYYKVCSDLIAEVIGLFDGPRFFHIGMDEERAATQWTFEYVVVRQFGLWWHDLDFYVREVEKGGSRAWVWADYAWEHPDDYFAKMPRSVLQSNWCYQDQLDPDDVKIRNYAELEKHGYDQVPTGSNWAGQQHNFERTVEFCRRAVAPERLLGFLQTPWCPTIEECRGTHVNAIDLIRRAREGFR